MKLGPLTVAVTGIALSVLAAGPAQRAEAGSAAEFNLLAITEPALDEMTLEQREAARLQLIDAVIQRAMDESFHRPPNPGVERWSDPRLASPALGPRDIIRTYGQMRVAHRTETPERGFESTEEEAVVREKVISCLMNLLDAEHYPGIRVDAARMLAVFGDGEVGEAKAGEVVEKLLAVLSRDPSPIVRLRAATSALWLDEGMSKDERVYRPLVEIAMDHGDVGWRLEDTSIRRSDLRELGMSGVEDLRVVKDDYRARAFELLASSVDRLSASERVVLRNSALDLRSTASVAPVGHGERVRYGEETARRREARRLEVLVERIERFVERVERFDVKEPETTASSSTRPVQLSEALFGTSAP
jgi:hypothetical protein